MSWLLFIGYTCIGYIFLTIVSSTIGAESASLSQSLGRFLKPVVFIYMLLGNVLLAAAIYYGFLATPAAVPILLCIGVITSSLYSVYALGLVITLPKVIGIMFILVGIYLLR